MGIHGLLPFLRPFAQRSNIKELRGKTVGIDAMCWMHKGAFACSQELVLGIDTHKFIHYFLRMCEILHFHNIKPVIVFDGARLPAKAKEESNRQETRENARQEALQLFERKRCGEYVDERLLASKCEAAIRISTEMISRLMTALRELSIKFIVAPFEADAQLAYMCRKGWVNCVISEDSDLLAYGCPNTFFKMDKYGEGEHIVLPCLQPGVAVLRPVPPPAVTEAEGIGAKQGSGEVQPSGEVDDADTENAATNQDGAGNSSCEVHRGRGRGRGHGQGRGCGEPIEEADDVVEDTAADETTEPNSKRRRSGGAKLATRDVPVTELANWTAEKFAEFCVFCGTDYKEPDIRIRGFGIKTAFKYLHGFGNAEAMISSMFRDKRWKDKVSCTLEEYISRFRSVLAVFWHHLVFDPTRGECLSIAASFPHVDRQFLGLDLSNLCGTPLPKEMAKRVAMGQVDARTLKGRDQTPLTPAERAALDRILAAKRSDQRQHEFEQILRADAQRAAEQRAAAEQRRSLQAPIRQDQPHPQTSAESHHAVGKMEGTTDLSTSSGHVEGEEEDEDAQPHQEMCLLPGDISTILRMKEEVLGERNSVNGVVGPSTNMQEQQQQQQQHNVISEDDCSTAKEEPVGPGSSCTPPRIPSSVQSETPPVAKANPFARKRNTTIPTLAVSAVLPRRQRVFGQQPRKGADDSKSNTPTGTPATAPAGVMSGREIPATQGETAEAQGGATMRMVEPEFHPRGGSGAAMSVAAVLAQRGIIDLEPVLEAKDRRKLTSFFKHKPAEKKAEAANEEKTKTKEGALAKWNPRPWEKNQPVDDPFAVGQNSLSLKATRGNPFRFT